MKELSHGAREVLEQGLAFDGPSDEQRVRVKQRMLVALGGGAVALGSAATAAGAGSATAAAGVVASATTAKGLLAGSLWVWFGIGIATGVGVSGAAAVVSMSSQPSVVAPSSTASTAGDALGSRVAPAGDQLSLTGSIQASASPAATALEPASEPGVRPNGAAVSAALPASDPSAATAAPSALSTLHDEAALLQSAQRALAAQQPDQALATLAEHERRFPAGVLREERQAARILAYCGVGRVDEARALVRTFAHSSPRSVLIPRLADSCAGDALKR
jgi:hypothetical protein